MMAFGMVCEGCGRAFVEGSVQAAFRAVADHLDGCEVGLMLTEAAVIVGPEVAR